ncbi:hypothetical protein RQ479_31085 [Mesorhizobium sp. ISC25]|uniref:hypothetical protein n=1 Tax=Mesorhizobium sp. ISC25 TaxID=3077335 RepID=UPI0035DDA37E
MSLKLEKLKNWTYRMSVATETGTAAVEVTIPPPRSKLYTEGEREIEACNAASGIVEELLHELTDVAIGES